ncbi:DUF6233 domain-containing protein [Streptomyces sp. NPDC001635]
MGGGARPAKVEPGRRAHGRLLDRAKSSRCVGVSRAQAVDALRQQVPACTHCRPDTALGVLD